MRRPKARIVFWVNGQGLMRLATISIMLLLVFFLFSYELPVTRTWSHWTMPLSGKVIAIDAGHGGPDGGAVSKEGLIEKEVTLSIALYLRDYLQQSGAIVIMTREEDIDLAEEGTRGYSKRKTEDLHRRVELIEQQKASMLISIHLNSIPSSKWTGAQTFYSTAHDQSQKLASAIQNELKINLNNTDRVAKIADTIFLIKSLKIPSALVEAGFLSNPQEAKQLSNDGYQRKVADSIYRGILRYISDSSEGK